MDIMATLTRITVQLERNGKERNQFKKEKKCQKEWKESIVKSINLVRNINAWTLFVVFAFSHPVFRMASIEYRNTGGWAVSTLKSTSSMKRDEILSVSKYHQYVNYHHTKYHPYTSSIYCREILYWEDPCSILILTSISQYSEKTKTIESLYYMDGKSCTPKRIEWLHAVTGKCLIIPLIIL